MNASHDFIFAFGHRARCERRGEKRPKMPMHRWLVAALLICIAATSLGCRSMMIFMARRISEPAATSPPVDIAVERDIVFAETPDGPLALDVYTLVDRPAAPLPVIVFVHGGGWFAGNKNQIQLGRGFELTRRGYAVVAVSYRLTDVAVFPAQIHDVKASIRWIRANASRRGFDASRIGVWGSSAGGHLVALMGVTNGSAELEGDVGGAALAGQSSDVQAVVDFFGPTQLVPKAGHEDATGWMVERLIGGTLVERRDVAVRASPATYVSASAAPILIVHGDEDEVVDPHQSTSYHALLVAAGADSTLRIVKGGGHGRGGEFSDRSLLAVVGEFFDRTLAPGRSVVNSSRLGYP